MTRMASVRSSAIDATAADFTVSIDGPIGITTIAIHSEFDIF
jgi:hypothetical protein